MPQVISLSVTAWSGWVFPWRSETGIFEPYAFPSLMVTGPTAGSATVYVAQPLVVPVATVQEVVLSTVALLSAEGVMMLPDWLTWTMSVKYWACVEFLELVWESRPQI